MGIIIEDVRYLDKFRPTETDVDWSLYNIGEPYDIEIDFRVEVVALAQSKNSDDFGWITLQPSTSFSGVLDPTGVIYADDPNAFEFFYVGDTITVTNNFNNSNNGSYTITEKIDNQTIRANTSFVNAYMKAGGTIHVTTAFNGVRYYWNWIENNGATNFIDVTSGEENQYYYDNATTGMGATPMVLNGDGTNEIGSTTIEGNGTFTYGQRFTLKHSGSVCPLFLASQSDDIQAQLKPDYFDAGDCLKHIFKIEANRDLSNPNDIQEVIYDERLGNTGWLNENYNGQEENYTFSNLVFTRVSDAATLDALELSTQVDATFTLTNTVDSPFVALSTQAMGVFWILPDSESRYQNNGRTLKENFVYDWGLATVNGGNVNGNNFGSTLQAIEEVGVSFVSSSELFCRIRFNFGSLSKSIVNENDFKKYVFGFTIENHSLTRETSDKTTLLINTNEFEIQLFDSNLITNNTKFLAHRFSDFADGVTTPDVFPVDDVVASSEFSIDFNGLESDGIDILNVSHELVLTHATNSDITLESNTYNTGGSTLLNGYIPLINVEQNRSFTIEDNDFRKLVTIQRNEVNDSGTVYAYKTNYPFFIRWEWWEALLGVSNPPAGVYDSSLPNNGLNHFWYRFSTLGYTLNYRLRFTIEQNGEQFTQEFDSALTMYDFNSNSEWNNEYIKSYDVSTSTELISGSDKFLQGYVDTRLESAFDKTIGTLPSLANIDIVFWIIGKEKGTFKSVRRASSFYSDSGATWFKGITTPNLVDKSLTSTLYEGKVLTDFSKLSGSEFTVYSRIHDNDILECFIIPNQGNNVSTFDPEVILSSGSANWNAGDGSADFVGNMFSHTYADTSLYEATLCMTDLSDVLGFIATSDNIVGELDFTLMDGLSSVVLPSNPLLTSVIWCTSTKTGAAVDISNTGINSSQDLSSAFASISSFKATNSPIGSYLLPTGSVLSQLQAGNVGGTGVLDLTNYDFTSNILINDNSYTNVLLPTSSNSLNNLNISNQTLNTFIDFSVMVNITEKNGSAINLSNNAITNASDINRMLVELDTNSTGSFTGRSINLSGGTNAAPDGSSGGYDGVTAVTNLTTKGFTVTTN